MSINIQLEWTPNPSTLKYVVDQRLLASGAANFTSPEAAEERSPLAKKLFGIQGVTGVMIGSNFVTVTKGEDGEWDELNERVMSTLDGHLSSAEPVVTLRHLVLAVPGSACTRPARRSSMTIAWPVSAAMTSQARDGRGRVTAVPQRPGCCRLSRWVPGLGLLKRN